MSKEGGRWKVGWWGSKTPFLRVLGSGWGVRLCAHQGGRAGEKSIIIQMVKWWHVCGCQSVPNPESLSADVTSLTTGVRLAVV